MAAVDVVMPAPPPPPPVPVVRISRLALAAADTVVCLWIASLWVLLASVAAALIGRLACGWGCTGAAWTAVLVSVLFVAIVWPLSALLLSKFVEPFYIDQLKKGAAALEPLTLSDAVIDAQLAATIAFAFLEAFGILLKLLAANNDPPTARFASDIMVVPPLGISVMCCFVSIPGLAVRVWRMRRHASASVVPI
ncbi:unnamed protein product [Miscanthus lutarioriparius]|uniref:Uncharacterized protein n=1 Tax=Miscanthus lutarioriparius TaxID=422564 RepID=A0A811R5Z6_9POAL|nr:unnamed protein product [Miscanthus lutarioriparius]